MPSQTPEAVIEAQRQDWNRVAAGWDKWDQFFNRNMAFINHRLVADARVRPGLRVLDLGSGTGYPALLAGEVVGSDGTVVGIDLAESMLAVATRKAKTLGLEHVTFRTGDVTSLPFETGSIDAVISRFCLMFLPEIPKAATEIARVLKPGGYVAAAVWSAPDKNPFIRIPMDVIKTITPLPPPDPEAPGIFRLADWLSGWTGGPPVFAARHPGRGCIMSAHAPYAIGAEEVDQWLACMRQALDAVEPPPYWRDILDQAFVRMCDALRSD